MSDSARRDLWSHWYGPAAAAAAALSSLAAYRQLPAVMATHWGLDGTPDGWSSRLVGAFLLPALMLGVWALLCAAPALDPRGANYAKFGGARDVIANGTLTLLLGTHTASLAVALGYPVPIARVVPVGVGLLLVAVGNVLPRVRPNFFIGVRTPWTLSSDVAWARTHRLAGHLLAAAGVVAVLAGLLLRPRLTGVVLLAAVLAAAGVSVVYSYVVWSREPDRGPRPGR